MNPAKKPTRRTPSKNVRKSGITIDQMADRKSLKKKPTNDAKTLVKHMSDRDIGFFEKGEEITTVYIGNMTYTKKEMDIKHMFRKFGDVNYVRLILDSKSQKSKGIAFVQMPSRKDAEKAIDKLNGLQMDGRTLKVSIAIESTPNKSSVRRPPRLSKDSQAPEKSQKPIRKRKPKGLSILKEYLDS